MRKILVVLALLLAACVSEGCVSPVSGIEFSAPVRFTGTKPQAGYIMSAPMAPQAPTYYAPAAANPCAPGQ